MKTILFVLAVLLCAGLGGYAAQTIALSQIASSNYPGVMVNVVGRGWLQAQIDSSLKIDITTNPVTLRAAGGGVGPTGPQGPQGVQGVQGIQGPAGSSAPTLPITVAPDGGIIVKSLQTNGTGPGTITFYKSDGTSCVLALLTNGSVICK